MQLPLLSHQLPLRIFQIISLSSAASATVIIDQATCTASGKSMIVTSALNEAFAMASNVASFTGVRERPTDYLLHSLLGMGTQYFSTAFNYIAQVPPLQTNGLNVVVYCGDSFLQQISPGHWIDTRDPQNIQTVSNIALGTDKGGFNCADGRFLGYAFLPSSIILCDLAFNRLQSGDGNTIGALTTETLSGQYLDSFNVLSGTLLHELLHIAGNMAVIDATVSASQAVAYGWANAVELAFEDNGGAQASTNADTLTLICIALYLRNTNFAFGMGEPVYMNDDPVFPDFSTSTNPKRRSNRIAREARWNFHETLADSSLYVL